MNQTQTIYKIGQWVRDHGNKRFFKIGHIGAQSYFSENKCQSAKFAKAELFEPKQGEYHWFWMHSTSSATPTLALFVEMYNGTYVCEVEEEDGVFRKLFGKCEPFVGQLPSGCIKKGHEDD